MSVRASSAVLEHSKSKGCTRNVLHVMADHHNRDTGLVCCSIARLMKAANIDSRRTVHAAINTLEQLGEA